MATKLGRIPGEANRTLLANLLAGRPVVQLKDLWIEAGLDPDDYADHPHMRDCHRRRLEDAGYRAIMLPAPSGAVTAFVRGPWPSDAHARPVPAGLRAYLEDGDPLMALLVGRVAHRVAGADVH